MILKSWMMGKRIFSSLSVAFSGKSLLKKCIRLSVDCENEKEKRKAGRGVEEGKKLDLVLGGM